MASITTHILLISPADCVPEKLGLLELLGLCMYVHILLPGVFFLELSKQLAPFGISGLVLQGTSLPKVKDLPQILILYLSTFRSFLELVITFVYLFMSAD